MNYLSNLFCVNWVSFLCNYKDEPDNLYGWQNCLRKETNSLSRIEVPL